MKIGSRRLRKNTDKLKLGIITFPISKAGMFPLSNLISILLALTDDVYLITGNAGNTVCSNDNKVHKYRVDHETGTKCVFSRVFSYVKTQLRISGKVVRLRTKVNIWFFFTGSDTLILPILAAKLLRRKVVLVSLGSTFRDSQTSGDKLAYSILLLQNLSFLLSDRITLYTRGLVEKQDLQKYQHKILIAHQHFLDFDRLKVYTKLIDRDNLVGYVGRLNEEKGVLNFVKAIPAIINERNGINFGIGGDGPLRENIESYLTQNDLNKKVKLAGWISRDDLPQYLNKFKLIVLPSYTEGLPNIMIEAMACGTTILASPVGSIPEYIKDGMTGFLMENNSPECIANNVLRVLNHSNLEQVANNGRALVENEFTFEKAVESFKEVLNTI